MPWQMHSFTELRKQQEQANKWKGDQPVSKEHANKHWPERAERQEKGGKL
jgi:hypothetical protein